MAKKILGMPKNNRYKAETALPYLEAALPTDGPKWLMHARENSLKILKEKGFPTPKLERWKYSDLPKALRKLEGRLAFANADVLYRNGENILKSLMAAEESDREQLNRTPLGSEKYQDMMLAELVKTYTRDGLIVDNSECKSVDKPVEIDIIGHNGQFTCPRTLFYVRPGTNLIIIETHVGKGSYWKNRMTRILVGKGAKLAHFRLQNDSHEAVYTQFTEVDIEENGTYEAYTLTEGASFSRNQIHVLLNGAGAHASLKGIHMISGNQHTDTTITIEHRAPKTTSEQFYRTLLAGASHGVFQGKAHIHEKAGESSADQLCNTVTVGTNAHMDTKPELEIYTDNVQCSHGATNNCFDDEPLFYMRTRGIQEEQARKLLAASFLSEVSSELGDTEFRKRVEARIQSWLDENLEGEL